MAQLLVAFLGILSFGCSYVPTTRLEYDPTPIAGATPVPLDLAVEPLREDRPARYYPSYAGRAFLTYVALIPWIKIPFERLDESWLKSTRTPEPWAEHGEHFTHKMSMAIVEDLARSNLFRSVRLADPSGEPVEADLTLRGTLRSTQFDAYVSSWELPACSSGSCPFRLGGMQPLWSSSSSSAIGTTASCGQRG